MERVRKAEVADEVARVRAEEEKVRADREREKRRRMRAEKKAADAAHEADVAAVLANGEKLLAANQEKWRQQELVLEEERRAMEREMEERARRRKQLLKENEERRVAGEEEAILSRKVGEKMAALNLVLPIFLPRALPDTSAADKVAEKAAAEKKKKYEVEKKKKAEQKKKEDAEKKKKDDAEKKGSAKPAGPPPQTAAQRAAAAAGRPSVPEPVQMERNQDMRRRCTYIVLKDVRQVPVPKGKPNGAITIKGCSWDDAARQLVELRHAQKPLPPNDAVPAGDWLYGCFLYLDFQDDGMVYVHGRSGDGSVDPASYGATNGRSLLLCFVNFCTRDLCPHGHRCRYRHVPLFWWEVIEILQTGPGPGFITKYLDLYSKPQPPGLGGTPVPRPAPGDAAERLRLEQLNSHGRPGGFASRGSGRGGRGGHVERPARPDNTSQYAEDFVSEFKEDDVPAAAKAAEERKKAKPLFADTCPRRSRRFSGRTHTSRHFRSLDSIKLSEADKRAALEDD
ncbi:hypothetical protein J4E80_005310 [Alternaria sp. BMP 0032]|nr:hypothetical protein J4E80_005310 [Alternaria sp. BMP 0032]